MPAAPTDRPRALVIEDDHENRTALVTLLRLKGIEVQSAATLEDGLEKLIWAPNCLLLDLILPDGSGIEILRRIRSQNLPIRVAVTTAGTNIELLAEAQKLGPDAILRKPYGMSELMNFIRPTPARKVA